MYRGNKLSPNELKNEYRDGSKIRLKGFTSTSLDRGEAIIYAIRDFQEKSADFSVSEIINQNLGDKKGPVLLEIRLKGNQ